MGQLDNKPWRGRKLHFAGLGGAGMSGVALVAAELGAEVTGSDLSVGSIYLKPLEKYGVECILGHSADNLPIDAELVVTSAVQPDNPELICARERDQTVLHRSELLAQISEQRKTIAVSGTHGKSSTSSMIVHALEACGFDPSFVIGAEIPQRKTNAYWGSGDWLVIEADESDRSLLNFFPEIAVVTNADWDHHANYDSLDDVLITFKKFLNQGEYKVVADDTMLMAIAGSAANIFTVTEFEATQEGSKFFANGVGAELAIPGKHNALNAAAAVEACRLAGADPSLAAASLHSFRGAERRFERLGRSAKGVEIVDDYAHHPVEVRASISAARTVTDGRLIVVFQPHLYSRTQHEAENFGHALVDADEVIVTDIYPAREFAADYPGVSAMQIVETLKDLDRINVHWCPTFIDIEDTLNELLQPNDLCVFMGAGDINKLAYNMVTNPAETLTRST